ncbi:TIGR02300 family protein [Jannaschia sp. W003]|uniref:TIGR02300 family protein n=1 Tax=Jannaschia sp. W003 TaxID=2867012 RepID=UPI0021A2B218|nr:TIGR02300 family protein [Jannaschia sp. W003]UWQ22119.1 TIGR02300 family protein [Jannaschia sp. W003]
MPKEEWGVKRVCPTTGKRFYDLNRDPVVSPYTGDVVPVETNTKTRVLVADKADADAKDEKEGDDLLLDDDEDVLEEDDVAADDDDDVLDDDDEGDTVSLDEIGGDVAETDDDD